MVEKNSARYIEILPKMVNSYNRTCIQELDQSLLMLQKEMKNSYGGKCIGLKNFHEKVKEKKENTLCL